MPGTDTIVALATPAGESAIAMIRVSGCLCPQLVENVFGAPPAKPRHATCGRYRDINNAVIDEVVYIYYADSASYTGQKMLEICGHGNPLIAQKMIEDLIERGCRMAEPGEFTRIAFLNGCMDLSQAEAVIDLIRARSDKAIEIAQKQLQGAVGKKVNELTDRLLSVIAWVEATIDFPEENLPPDDQPGPIRDLQNLCGAMERLISTSHYSSLLHNGIKVVITGPPNTGKSSLLNFLTGEERVIVSPEPGTTRDFIEANIMIGSYSMRIIDTAGLHSPDSDIERQGIEKTCEQVENADFHLVVINDIREVICRETIRFD